MPTPRLGMTEPAVASVGWGTTVNTNFDLIDAAVEILTNKNTANGYAGLDSSAKLTASQLPNPSATTLGGVQSLAAVATKFLTSISTSGVPVAAQPAFTDISGTAAAAQLPNPATAAKGGVFSKAAASHNFLTSISSVDGSVGQAQPASTDLSDVATLATLTGSQVLTGKTLVTPSSANIVTMLAALTFGASAAITGTGAAANVFSGTVLGATFAASKGLKIKLFFSHTTGTANVTYALSYGGTSNAILISSVTGLITVTIYLMNDPGVTNAQHLLSEPYFNGTAVVGGPFSLTYAKDSTVNQTLSVTFNVANTDQVTPLGMITELIQ